MPTPTPESVAAGFFLSDHHDEIAGATGIKRLEVLDAAVWLINVNDLEFNCDDVWDYDELFCWGETPQGSDFWIEIDNFCRHEFGAQFLLDHRMALDWYNKGEAPRPITIGTDPAQPTDTLCPICSHLNSHSPTCHRGRPMDIRGYKTE
jgi:hypothetical protein